MRVVTLLGKQNLLRFFRQNLCAQYSKGETLVFKLAYWLTWGKVELPCNEKNLAFWKFSAVMKYKSWAAPIGRQAETLQSPQVSSGLASFSTTSSWFSNFETNEPVIPLYFYLQELEFTFITQPFQMPHMPNRYHYGFTINTIGFIC